MTGLAFNPAGDLLLTAGGSLHTMNTATGGPSASRTLDHPEVGIFSLTVDAAGTVYGLRERTAGAVEVLELVTIDPATGAVSVRGPVPDTMVSIAMDRTPAAQPQDPGPGPGGTATPPPDTTAASVMGLRLARRKFRAAASGGSVAAAATGTGVSYRLSEPATAGFRVQRALAGRRVGGRCVAVTRRNRAARRCTRYSTVRGSFTHAGNAGLNRFRFTGRLRGRKLRVGAYRLALVATDAAGNRSPARYATFRIVRR
jgi:hypothetical protein